MSIRKKLVVGLGAAVASFILLALLAVNRVTPVSHQEAVDRFREERETIGHKPESAPAPATPRGGKGGRGEGKTPGRGTVKKAASEEPQNPPGATVPQVKPPQGIAPKAGGDRREPWPVMPVVVRPAEGVYTYRTDGHEGFEGIFDREFPPTSHRTIVHTGPTTWSDHTIFSEERESWNNFEFRRGQRVVHSQRNRIEFSAYERDETVTFTPPLASTRYPWSLGNSWTGKFSGETYGTYRVRTDHREYVTVGKQRVPAWGDRLDVELHGRIEGTVVATRWLSPEYGLTLREEYRADAWLGPIHYIAEWSVTLASVEPAT